MLRPTQFMSKGLSAGKPTVFAKMGLYPKPSAGRNDAEGPIERRGEVWSQARDEGQSEAPAEALGKTPDKASAKAADPQHSEPHAAGPDLRPAAPRAAAPVQRRSLPSRVPTSQKPPNRPGTGPGQPLGERSTGGGV